MQIKLLSAGAVQPGLTKVLDAFRRETGCDVTVTFATAPALRKRLGESESVDVVIAPPDVLDEFAKAGKVQSGDGSTVGRIGVGVAVRAGASMPKIATVDEFKESLLKAESVVYNQASTGLYLENLFRRLGIGESLKNKTTRYPDFAAVRDHVSKGTGNEIGLGATTVIVESASKGLQFVGPLPEEIQNYTAYAVTVATDSSVKEAAISLVRYLGSPNARDILKAAGIE